MEKPSNVQQATRPPAGKHNFQSPTCAGRTATPSERARLDMLTGLGRDFSAGHEHSLCSPAAVD
jgi:hypothetical protein